MLTGEHLKRAEDLGGHLLCTVLVHITRSHHQGVNHHEAVWLGLAINLHTLLESLIKPHLPSVVADGYTLLDIAVDVGIELGLLGRWEPKDTAILVKLKLIYCFTLPDLSAASLKNWGRVFFLDVKDRTRVSYGEEAKEICPRGD